MDVTISSQVRNIKTDAVTFCGLFDPLPMKANDMTKLFLGNENTLYYPNAEMTINAFRAYFQLADGITADTPVPEEQGVRVFVLNFDDQMTTGIIDAAPNHHQGMTNSQWFTIDGRKLSGKPSRKGVYINSGRAVMVK